MLYDLFTKDMTGINQSVIKKRKSWIFLYQIPFQKLPSKLSPSAYFLFGLNPEKSSLPIVIGNSENESFLFSQHLPYQATFIVTCVVPKKSWLSVIALLTLAIPAQCIWSKMCFPFSKLSTGNANNNRKLKKIAILICQLRIFSNQCNDTFPELKKIMENKHLF